MAHRSTDQHHHRRTQSVTRRLVTSTPSTSDRNTKTKTTNLNLAQGKTVDALRTTTSYYDFDKGWNVFQFTFIQIGCVRTVRGQEHVSQASCHRAGTNDQAFPTPNATRRVPTEWVRTIRSSVPVRGPTRPDTPLSPHWREEDYPKSGFPNVMEVFFNVCTGVRSFSFR